MDSLDWIPEDHFHFEASPDLAPTIVATTARVAVLEHACAVVPSAWRWFRGLERRRKWQRRQLTVGPRNMGQAGSCRRGLLDEPSTDRFERLVA